MTTSAPHPGASLWLDDVASSPFPALEGRQTADVAVVGAGIVGLTTALLLHRAGRRVCVVESGRIGGGVTGHSTAKITSQHGLIYRRLQRRRGEQAARIYASANQAAISTITGLVQELRITCDLERRPAFVFARDARELPQLHAEVEIARRLGLPAAFTQQTDLPFPVPGAVRFDDQAQFHPGRYLAGLAGAIVAGDGGTIYENSRVRNVGDGRPCQVTTDDGVVESDVVVLATNLPIVDRGLFFARTTPARSYVIAVRIAGPAPQGMYITAGSPTRSIRSAPTADGEVVLIGGEGHKTGQGASAERYARLEAYAREHFAVRSVDYRWSTHDYVPADGVPYVGRVWPLPTRIFTATGLQKWGMTNGTVAAILLSDAIQGVKNPWAPVFDTNRFTPRASFGAVLGESLNDARRFVLDRLPTLHRGARVPSGHGRVVTRGGGPVAVSRDEDGTAMAVSAVCTHLRCVVKWNDAECTWDCPCHGSRFARDGSVLRGPAVKPLRQVSLPYDDLDPGATAPPVEG